MRRRGFTLFEVMVGVGLTGLLLGVIVAVLLPLGRQVARAYTEMDLCRTAVALDGLLRSDLALCRESTLALSGPREWGMRRLEPRLAGSSAVFSSDVVVYRWEGAVLRRSVVSFPGEGLPVPLPVAMGRVVAGGVADVSFAWREGVRVRVVLRASGREYVLEQGYGLEN